MRKEAVLSGKNTEKKKDFIWPSHHHLKNCLVVTSSGNKKKERKNYPLRTPTLRKEESLKSNYTPQEG